MSNYASFEDILFILAGLVWVAYSAYRANKKKAKSQLVTTNEDDKKAKGFFDEFLEQFNVQEATEQKVSFENSYDVATPAANLESNITNGALFSYDDVYEKKEDGNRNHEASTERNETQEDVEISAEQRSFNRKASSSFNLKRAFIYSEILNNKYI